MKIQLLIILSIFTTQAFSQATDKKTRIENYIKQYKQMAMTEQQRVGIPAAITLAQGIHETNAGASELAVNANNHFGIKCKKEWKGETYTYTDDRPDECFRKYKNDIESYKDHSDYLKNSKRYESLFNVSMTDYAGWAYGLKRCGYATNPKYAQLLIKTIEDNHLQEYTYAALDKNYDPIKDAEKPVVMGNKTDAGEVVPEKDAPLKVENKPQPDTKKTKMVVNDGQHRYTVVRNSEKPAFGQTIMVNGLKAFYAKKDASLLNEAMKYNVRYARLLELNDLPDEPLESDMFVYLEKKNTKGMGVYHVVKPGETMQQIAQIEGMQLKALRQFNKIRENEEPVSGTLLQLQETIDKKPEVIVKKKETSEENMVFSGSERKPIPQGTTRMKAGYISKDEIENDKGTKITTRKVIDEETNETKTQVTITKPTEVVIDKDVLASPEKKVVVVEEETTTITPEKDVIVEKVTTTQSLGDSEESIVVEEETTTISENKKDVVVEKNTVVVPSPVEEPNKDVVNIADTKAVEEEKPAAKEEEPKDEFARLKARLDKAVYASENAKKKMVETKQEEPAEDKENKKEVTKSAESKPIYYTVKKGDNAFAIAKKHNITMTQLKDWNKLDFKEIKVGQKLRVK